MKTEKRSAFPRRLTHETDAAAADFRVGGPVGVFPVEYPPHGRRNRTAGGNSCKRRTGWPSPGSGPRRWTPSGKATMTGPTARPIFTSSPTMTQWMTREAMYRRAIRLRGNGGAFGVPRGAVRPPGPAAAHCGDGSAEYPKCAVRPLVLPPIFPVSAPLYLLPKMRRAAYCYN